MTTPRILVVDDEDGPRVTLVANLELAGFEIVEAANVDEALARLAEGRFDLVLSDVRMPGKSGVDLLKVIHSEAPDLPVVLMTAFTDDASIVTAVTEGVFTVLNKPFEIDRAIVALRRAIQRPLVVVVDDVESFAAATAAALSTVGIEAVATNDGDTTLALLGERRIDVCVVDLMMPGMNGVELIQRIRALAPEVSCIVFTGAQRIDDLVRDAVASGAHECLRKPLDPVDLARSIVVVRGVA